MAEPQRRLARNGAFRANLHEVAGADSAGLELQASKQSIKQARGLPEAASCALDISVHIFISSVSVMPVHCITLIDL